MPKRACKEIIGARPTQQVASKTVTGNKKAKTDKKDVSALSVLRDDHATATDDTDFPNINAEHMVMVSDAVHDLVSHPKLVNLATDMPVTIESGAGHKAPFNQKMFEEAISNNGLYEAAGNLFWVNFRWSAIRGVPVNIAGIKDIQKLVEAGDLQPLLARARAVGNAKREGNRIRSLEPHIWKGFNLNT